MENLENEKMENYESENESMVVSNNGNVLTFNDMRNNTNTETRIFTNIKDRKKLFNLENDVDYLINDCEGEKIRVKEILIKTYKKLLKTPIIDDETGEVIKEYETSMSCVLIDDNNKSYATGSKMFIIQLMRYLDNYGDSELNEGLEIEIIRKKLSNSNNKGLAFKLV